jgi:hypothetical protein
MERELTRAECVEVDVEEPVAAETAKAIGIFIEGPRGELTWIPRSAIHEDSEVTGKGDAGVLLVARWCANDRGLV